jgi:histidine ammonia-lyase
MDHHLISDQPLSLEDAIQITTSDRKLKLSDEAIQKINSCRNYLDEKIKKGGKPIYGVNTGFGSLCNTIIPQDQIEQLQTNLVISHACGVGEEAPKEIVKLMLLFKIQGLSYGHSGIALETVNRLIDLYNNNLLPVIYQQGSLGASGDLAPLAHLVLPLIGLGEIYKEGKKITGEEMLQSNNWKKIGFQSKEGLALLNGTQFMSSYGVYLINQSIALLHWANLIGAASLEAYDGSIDPFNSLVHKVRGHKGQMAIAEEFQTLLKGSEIIFKEKEYVQDPYSFRCIPQVHGATYDVIQFVKNTFETEINSVTDNPTIFPKEDLIISAGNFHGQPLALGLDNLSIAMAELGSISERRIYKLTCGGRGLPEFLTPNAGLNSGFMISQYTAASIVSQNKQLCSPASVDTIDSSKGQEDHVSMGANAATKALRVIENVEKVLAIELLTAMQALDFRKEKSSEIIHQLKTRFRKKITFSAQDRLMYQDINSSLDFIKNNHPEKLF